MKISLIIPAYNEEKYIRNCIESVLENKHEALFELIVVDNGSQDKTFEVASSFREVKVLSEPRKGVAFARQRGLVESTGDIIAYVDADATIMKGWFKQIVEEFSSDPKLVCLSGPWFCIDSKTFYRISTHLYWLFLGMPSYFLVGYMAVGGNMVIRRGALIKAGGFDETISFYGDDTDIARRLNKIGRVKFKFGFNVNASGRRFKGQGIVRTGFLYVINFLSEVFLHRPASKAYRDIR